MAERHPTEQRFYFRPDWRAELPFALMPFRVARYIGVQAAIMWLLWHWAGFQSLIFQIFLLLWAAQASRGLAAAVARDVEYRRKIRGGAIRANAEGIRLPLAGSAWKEVTWAEVTSLREIRAGGLLGDGLIRVNLDSRRLVVPGYVEDRDRLLRLIRRRAGLTEEHRTWWATTWRRPSAHNH